MISTSIRISRCTTCWRRCSTSGCTHRIRLGPNVLIVPYRPPIQTAKLLTALDVLSGGRLTVGVGVGWMEEEFEALGVPPYAGGARSPTSTCVCSNLYGPRSARTFEGRYCRVSDIGFLPKRCRNPIRRSGSEGIQVQRCDARRSLATHGYRWGRSLVVFWPDELQPKIARLRELTRQAGRAEESVKICLGAFVRFEDETRGERLPLKGTPEQIADDVMRYQAIGIDDFILYLGRGGDTSRVMEAMERFARDVVPLLDG